MDRRILLVPVILALAIVAWDPYYEGRETWSIGIYMGDHPFNLSGEGIANPVLTAGDVTDADAAFLADPFMIEENGSWHMFFEAYNLGTDQGDIGLATSQDGIVWGYQQIVLDEPFHLSYPLVFEVGGTYYMVPESEDADEVRLYKATDFPYGWSFERTLIDKGFRDSTLFEHEGRWYMFTTDSNDMLYLYHADGLEGPWLEHPASPVVEHDANIARPGGRVLVDGDTMFRLAQDDWPLYGNRVMAFEILYINETDYAEKGIPDGPIVQGDWDGWNWRGMHHIDAHRTDAGWIAAVDGH